MNKDTTVVPGWEWQLLKELACIILSNDNRGRGLDWIKERGITIIASHSPVAELEAEVERQKQCGVEIAEVGEELSLMEQEKYEHQLAQVTELEIKLTGAVMAGKTTEELLRISFRDNADLRKELEAANNRALGLSKSKSSLRLEIATYREQLVKVNAKLDRGNLDVEAVAEDVVKQLVIHNCLAEGIVEDDNGESISVLRLSNYLITAAIEQTKEKK